MLMKREFYDFIVEKFMDADFPVVEKDAPIGKVIEILKVKTHTWVVDEPNSRKLVGVITEKDFLNIISPLPPKSWTIGFIHAKSLHHSEMEHARDLMNAHIISCKPEDTLERVLYLMQLHKIRRLPVMKNDE